MAMLGAQQVQTAACTPDLVFLLFLIPDIFKLSCFFFFKLKFACLQVGNAFVHQYYHILHHSPQHVHRFYQDISKLGRPEDNNGTMSITSTLQVSLSLLTYFFFAFLKF